MRRQPPPALVLVSLACFLVTSVVLFGCRLLRTPRPEPTAVQSAPTPSPTPTPAPRRTVPAFTPTPRPRPTAVAPTPIPTRASVYLPLVGIEPRLLPTPTQVITYLPLVGVESTRTPLPPPDPFSNGVVVKGTKLGIHGLSSSDTLAFLQQAIDGGTTLPVVKAVDNFAWLQEVKEMSPGTITLARVTGPGQDVSDEELRNGDLQAIAERVMGNLTAPAAEYGDYVDYWEPTNELDPPSPDLYVRFAQLHFRFMDIAERDGYKIGLFTFNVGTPEWDEMVAIADTGVFSRAKQGGHILTVHEGVFGDAPIDYQWGEVIPGAPSVEGAGALCFRYRYLYHLLEQRDEVIPLVVSEIVFGAGYERDGASSKDIAAREAWYGDQARQDHYLWGYLPFTLGTYEDAWNEASYAWAYSQLIDHAVAIKDEPNGLPPADALD